MGYTNTQRYILAFKAGRALRRDGTNFVDPKAEKGAIILYDGEDDLLHFVWKDRTTGNIGEVCIVVGFHPSFRFSGRITEAPVRVGSDHVRGRCLVHSGSQRTWRENLRP